MKRFRQILVVVALWLVGVATWIAIGPSENAASKADVAIVLGAAVDGDVPSPVFRERIAHAVDLYDSGRVGALMFTGGRSPEDALAESEAARAMALTAGVPQDRIFIETRSRTTRQSLVEAQQVMAREGFDTALVVSDPLHLRRASAMASGLGIAADPSATPTTRYRTWRSKLPFLLRETYFMHHYWFFGA